MHVVVVCSANNYRCGCIFECVHAYMFEKEKYSALLCVLLDPVQRRWYFSLILCYLVFAPNCHRGTVCL